MPNGRAFEDAVRIASSAAGLGVGVHLSLVGGRSVAPIPEVAGLAARDGSLPPSYGAFLRDCALRRFGVRELRAEIEAQIARVLAAGIRPTHLDSHQHLHLLPGVLDVAIDAAKSAGIPVIRLPCERAAIGGRRLGRSALSILCRQAAPKLRKAGIHFADHFFGFGVSGRLDDGKLAQILGCLGPGVNELMCHPGFGDPETGERYPWGYQWDKEAAALCSAHISRRVEELGVRLAAFGQAWSPVP